MSSSLVVLAAGIGSRFGGLKQLEKLGPHGETLIDYSIYNAIQAGYKHIIMVIRKENEQDFKKFFSTKIPSFIELQFVFQGINDIPSPYTVPKGRTKPWGTGHALMLCEEVVSHGLTMINGDDYYAYDPLKTSYDFLESSNLHNSEYLNLCYKLKNTLSPYGTVSRGICTIDENNKLLDLVEHKKVSYNNNTIYSLHETGKKALHHNAVTSMNLMSFTPTIFAYLKKGFGDFLENTNNIMQDEFLIPPFLAHLKEQQLAEIAVIQTNAEWFGITYKDDVHRVKNKIAQLIAEEKFPNSLWGNNKK